MNSQKSVVIFIIIKLLSSLDNRMITIGYQRLIVKPKAPVRLVPLVINDKL
ncbi:hypothetical protein yruck0001_13360 [Yersinia ruckeri ATCC 29473]|nr:hypothetical protein yruck0001_13360 [Yersinia ruckeri ATCC 29473]